MHDILKLENIIRTTTHYVGYGKCISYVKNNPAKQLRKDNTYVRLY